MFLIRSTTLVLLCLVVAACTEAQTRVEAAAEPDAMHDLVIVGGRVIDPESATDALLNVGIRDGSVVTLAAGDLQGERVLDASGLVVAPGFIDIHSHSPTPLGARFQVLDGVTSQLDLEAGAWPVAAYGFLIADAAPLNFGSSVSHLAVRIKVIEGVDQPYLFTATGPMVPGAAFVQPADAAQIEAMRALLNAGIDEGGLGIGVLLDYLDRAVSAEELRMIFEVAAARSVPIAIHVRRGLPGDPAGLIEAIELAQETGAAVLICHITHNAMQATPAWLARIDAANASGAWIAAETLSYAAGGTSIGADVFNRDWQRIFDITYEDVQWTATGEWLTEESWRRYRAEQPAGMVNHHYVKEEWLDSALRWPSMMVSSDVTPAMDEAVLANPNLAGTFSRVLGHYVRERGLFSLAEGLARLSLLQARWLEGAAPVFARKGRLQVGMDADIVVFDPDTVAGRATYGDPYRASAGIEHVVVAGQPVVVAGALQPQVRPGRRLSGGP